ncbi:MAG: HAMP domain-containing histidine kinase, partial [Synechococcaceae cyanobacterium SM2_3_1]|nr:HAMP domain-containing histidine kinase [Synechococcaceae cyanobacterium SM2_3_1]
PASRLYQSAQQQVYRLQELNQLKDEFVHMVSHELRTPLTNMKMALTMMEARPEPERQQRYLHLLKLEWQRELSLVNELLELLAMESGKRQLELEPLQLLEWIPRLTDSLQMRFLERQLQFIWRASPDLPLFTTDVRLLERILVELLNNACKYTPPLHQVHLEIYPHGQGIRVQVTNTGVEIPVEQLPKIFEKFHRITALDRYQQGGTGLGLALVKKAVEFLQGQIQATSREGCTCFQVDLPLL